MTEVVLEPRKGVDKLIDLYGTGKITYRELCKEVAALGYDTKNIYEMVRGLIK